jgi:dTDP-4-dehydrorhamnose reductase
MRIIILGGDGMLGHRLFATLRNNHDARVTLHRPLTDYREFALFDAQNAYAGVDLRALPQLMTVFADFRPEVVVNCAGLIKQRDEARDPIANIEINALLPHRLAQLCRMTGARLIQISTDCVFSGRRGMYGTGDLADADDLYGRAKLLGEVSAAPSLTLRTSMIGRELARKHGLLEWFLAQEGAVPGYRRAVFSGLTTAELSRVIKAIIERHQSVHGLYHVASQPIDKFTLLHLIRERFGKQIEIVPDTTVVIDRSLDGSEFCRQFGYEPPAWTEMVAEL